MMPLAFLSALRSWAAQTAEYDGARLVLALVLMAALVLASIRHPGRLVRGSLILFLLHLGMAGLAEVFAHDSEGHEALRLTALFLLLACIGRSLFLLTTQVVFPRSVGGLPKIFLDIVHGLVYVAAFMITLRAAGVQPASLLTGSALITATLGLSLRDTLGNIFAGLAIQAQRPFEVGDWIQFDADKSHIGEVIEINWRATKVLTLDQVEIVIPNARLGDGQITNFTKPHRFSRRSLYVRAPLDVPPQRVQAVILQAIRGSFGVLDDPPPSVVTLDFAPDGVQYWVRFFTTEFHRRDGVDGGVRDRIWYAMTREGIPIPYPQQTVHWQGDPAGLQTRHEASRREQRHRTLRCVDFLESLGEDCLDHLAQASHTRLYGAGETVIRQGEAGHELFVVQRGEVIVSLERAGESAVELARLGPGQFFGEMSLLTGEPRTATARAQTECELVVVDKSALACVLSGHPDLAERVSSTVASRRADLAVKRERAGENQTDGEDWGPSLLRRIRDFFKL
jgi:small-conductance mechanosensitive channel